MARIASQPFDIQRGKTKTKAVRIEPPIEDRRGRLTQLELEKFQVTDRGLAIRQGMEFDRGEPGYRLTRFAPGVPGIGGQAPDIDRNPYNFVAFAGPQPWLERAPAGHDKWDPQLLSGRVRLSAVSLTPVFVPTGFPFDASDGRPRDAAELKKWEAEKKKREADLRKHRREFFRMRRSGETKPRYAIPGASLKGVLRCEIEALTNDRFGAINHEFYEKAIPYRRRVWDAAVVERELPDGSFELQTADVIYFDRNNWGSAPFPPSSYDYSLVHFKNVAAPGSGNRLNPADLKEYRANLLWLEPNNHKWTHILALRTGKRLELDAATVKQYRDNIEHTHYENHAKSADSYRAKPDLRRARKELKEIHPGDILYCTHDGQAVNSFGKNVNYLWRATHSVNDFVKKFVRSEESALSLDAPLGIADRLFGFVAPHKDKQNEKSHPFRGKIRIETLWGPLTSEWAAQPLQLAPLTAPQTRGKSRPLYLEGRQDGTSASYSDGNPILKGRKFYWHQNAAGLGSLVWEGHRATDLHQDVETQLPPPLDVLPAGTRFDGCIHFDNLSPRELGALLFALAGDGSYRHAIKVGKAKPRGLGSMEVRIEGVDILQPNRYYGSLDQTNPYMEGRAGDFVEAFKKWCLHYGGRPQGTASGEFSNLPHIRDYVKLHTWPANPSVRYYPINFSQYGWLPLENRNPDEPAGRRPRPPAMKRARDLQP